MATIKLLVLILLGLVVLGALIDLGHLALIEIGRLRVFMFDLMHGFQVQLAQLGASRHGLEEWEATSQTIRRVLAQPGARPFWDAHTGEFPRTFVAGIDRLISD